MPIEKRLLTLQELAEYLGMKRGSIYNARATGEFPIKPIEIKCQGKQRPAIRYDRVAVDRWLDSQAEQTKEPPLTPRRYKTSQASTGKEA
jgi:predicted DNA-binding transcriptional regulator AlpA